MKRLVKIRVYTHRLYGRLNGSLVSNVSYLQQEQNTCTKVLQFVTIINKNLIESVESNLNLIIAVPEPRYHLSNPSNVIITRDAIQKF